MLVFCRIAARPTVPGLKASSNARAITNFLFVVGYPLRDFSSLQLGGEVSNTGRGEYGRTDLTPSGVTSFRDPRCWNDALK